MHPTHTEQQARDRTNRIINLVVPWYFYTEKQITLSGNKVMEKIGCLQTRNSKALFCYRFPKIYQNIGSSNWNSYFLIFSTKAQNGSSYFAGNSEEYDYALFNVCLFLHVNGREKMNFECRNMVFVYWGEGFPPHTTPQHPSFRDKMFVVGLPALPPALFHKMTTTVCCLYFKDWMCRAKMKIMFHVF